MDGQENNRYKEAFILLDENQSGFIEIDQLHFLIRALGFTPTKRDLEKADRKLINIDKIDYLQFTDFMQSIDCAKYSYEQIQTAFAAFDEPHHGISSKNSFFNTLQYFLGLINRDKFKEAMMSMGEPLTEIEMNEMFIDLPFDEDGYIE